MAADVPVVESLLDEIINTSNGPALPDETVQRWTEVCVRAPLPTDLGAKLVALAVRFVQEGCGRVASQLLGLALLALDERRVLDELSGRGVVGTTARALTAAAKGRPAATTRGLAAPRSRGPGRGAPERAPTRRSPGRTPARGKPARGSARGKKR